MSNNVVFYHMYCVNDCYERFVNTYNKIVSSGLIDKIQIIKVVLVGPLKTEVYNKLNQLFKTELHIRETTKSEAETLRLIWDYCQSNTCNVLYLHSKGVTKPNHKNIQDWKNLMEYFLIENFQPCLDSLQTHDVCGVNYLPGRPHYSGNYWWATSKHIKKLKQLKPEVVDRLYCEYWLFDINDKIERKEIYNSGIDHYKNSYPLEKYALKKS